MTVVRVLTPVGRGAIAVVEVAGPDAVAMVEARFEPAGGRPLADGPIDAIRFGRWRASDNASDSGEELVVVRTAEDRVEVHCHGGVAASAAIIAALSASGATTEASRAPVSIADDAHRLLAEAPTERVAGLLLDQANGALKAAIDSALGALESGDVEPAQLLLEHLLLHERLALHGVVAPWRVVLAGPPNAGKSSLKNALVGYERAIVYDQPGTTRDVVTTTTAIGGWPVQLADTAGVRETDDPLEAAGVRLAEQALAAADVAVVVCEAAAFESDHSAAARERLVFATPQEVARIDVASKADLGPSPLAIDPPAIVTSVKTGRGLAELTAAIERAICPTTPAAGDAIPFRAEHVGQLQRAAERLPNDPAAAKAALQALLASEVPSD